MHKPERSYGNTPCGSGLFSDCYEFNSNLYRMDVSVSTFLIMSIGRHWNLHVSNDKELYISFDFIL